MNAAAWSQIGTLIGAVIAIFGIAVWFTKGTSDNAERIASLEADNKVFWSIMQPHLANIIHQDVAPRRDALIEEFTVGKPMARTDLLEMVCLLKVYLDDDQATPAKRLAAALLTARAEQELSHMGADPLSQPRRRKGDK